MTTVTQNITTMPTPALGRSMEAEAFITAADADVIARGGLVTELNTWTGQVNTVAGEVNANAGTATTQAGIATTQAGNASTSAANALTSENNAKTAETNAAASESNAAASAAQAAASAASLHGTSTTSLLIAVASKTFTTQADEAYTAGVWITATSAANIANWMYGQVTSYSGTTLIVDVQVIGGSGTYADWNLSISAARGAQGIPGTGITPESVGFTATGGTTPKTLTVDDDLTTTQAARRNAANTFTAAQNLARATVASHATTGDIWGAAGNQIDWTGTATTTAFPNAPQAGAERVLICAGACSFTAGANMLIDGVASAATVTCAANDQVIVRAVSTTQFKLSRVKYDGTAQVAAGGGIDSAATVTTSTTLTSASDGYQYIAMTTMGQSVTLPDATTLAVGAPKYYLDNSSGGYPVGIRNTSGTLLMAIAAGGMAYVSCESIGTAAGVWSITGTNLEPGLITIDNTFSSTYASTVLNPFVALDDNKSIHFLALASGFAAVAVDKTTGAVGTPVTVSAGAGYAPFVAFKITAATAIVFYGGGGDHYAVVVSLSGATTLAVGTATSNHTGFGSYGEDFSGAPKIAQLDSTHYLVSYCGATGAGTTSVVAYEVTSGTTVTRGAAADIITANNVINSTTTYALTATTGLVIYLDDAASPYSLNAAVISVSGTTCTVGTPATVANVSNQTQAIISTVLSATKVLCVVDNNNANVYAYAVTISGTSVSFGAALNVEAGTFQSYLAYISSSATRYNPHLFPLSASTALLWYFDSSGISRAVVLSESGGTVTNGAILYRSISAAAVTAVGGGFILPQGTSEFVSLKSQSAQTGNLGLYPCKISGTAITTGAGIAARELPPNRPDQVSVTRMSTGDYVYTSGATAQLLGGPAPQELLVFRSNGEFINKRGTLKVPPLVGNYGMVPYNVSANRLVILGATPDGTTVAATTYQIRLLNIEVAA